MPITLAIYGPESGGCGGLCFYNCTLFEHLCVILLENKRGNKANFGKLLCVIKNPIIIGAIFGLIVKLLNWTLPEIFEKVVVDMSKVKTPLALILLGAGLKYGNIQNKVYYSLFVSVN